MRADAGQGKKWPSPSASPRGARGAESAPAKVVLVASVAGRESRLSQGIKLRASGGAVRWRAAVSTPLLELSSTGGVVAAGGIDGFAIRLTPLARLAAAGAPAIKRLYLDCGRTRAAILRIAWSGQSAAKGAGVISLRVTFRRPCP
jgi:hypothetical protein